MALHPAGGAACGGVDDCRVVPPAAGFPRQEEQGHRLRLRRAALRRQPAFHYGGAAQAPARCGHCVDHGSPLSLRAAVLDAAGALAFFPSGV